MTGNRRKESVAAGRPNHIGKNEAVREESSSITPSVASKHDQQLREIVQTGLPLALAALTAFGVAGYAVGRAYLEGWYGAAGVSALTFNWDLQYVVLRGLSADVLNLWMLFIFSFAGMMFCTGAVEFASSKISQWWPKTSNGPTNSDQKSAAKPHLKQWVKSILVSFMLLSLAGLWFSGAKLLNSVPKQQGRADFSALLMAATCPAQSDAAAISGCAKPGTPIGSYPWVEVRSSVLQAGSHGWLLQQQGSTLLLLSHSGISLLSFGDSPFIVSTANISTIGAAPSSEAASSEASPQFKAEAEPDVTAAPKASKGASSPAPIARADVPDPHASQAVPAQHASAASAVQQVRASGG